MNDLKESGLLLQEILKSTKHYSVRSEVNKAILHIYNAIYDINEVLKDN